MNASFKLLFWKNFKTEKRMWLHFFGEVCAILLIFCLIIASLLDQKKYVPTLDETKSGKVYEPIVLTDLYILQSNNIAERYPEQLAYEPDNDFTELLTSKVAGSFGLEMTTEYNPHNALAKLRYDTNHKASVMPDNLTVRISFPGKFRTYTSDNVESNLWRSRCSGMLTQGMSETPANLQMDLYVREGFLQVQHKLFETWFKMKGSNTPYEVRARSFRYDTAEQLCQSPIKTNVQAVLLYFTFFFPFLNLIWKYGRERQENMLAQHWRYGCNKPFYWLAHFLCSFLHFGLLNILISVLTAIHWATRASLDDVPAINPVILFAFLLFVSCEIIIAAIIVVTVVPKAKYAIYVGMLLWMFLFALFCIVLEYSYDLESFGVIFSLITFFNNAFPYGVRYLSELNDKSNKSVWVLFGIVCASILIKLMMLSVAQWVRPGRYVERLPFGFFGLRWVCIKCGCYKRCCSCCKTKKRKLQVQTAISIENYQFGPLHGDKYVIASRISKSFKKFRQGTRETLKRVNMTIYRGEITVILGHNGTGKTSLIAILAGWNKPEEGNIVMLDKDMETYSGPVGELSDIVMQTNALFDYLTAAENLEYFVWLKIHPLRRSQYRVEVNNWLKVLQPAFLENLYTGKLLARDMTFEQKRLLTLCCCLACDTKIVLLDEPTTHMRSDEQRLYWSILQREKATRAIVVTTYSFREAETIGDRIAILTDGSLKAYGTPMFLKTTFGTGFDLIILKAPDAESQAITNFLQEYIQGVKPDTEIRDQLVYKISPDKRPIFQVLLINLNKRRDELGIRNVRLLSTDLSEVYMTLGRIKDRQTIPEVPQALSVDYLPKKGRIRQQWAAMFFKKLAHQPSHVIPIFMVLISFVLILIFAQLTAFLRVKPLSDDGMMFGIGEEDNRDILKGLSTTSCKYFGVKNVQAKNTLLREKGFSLLLTTSSIYCEKKHVFEDSVRILENERHYYGAVAFKEDKCDIYINQHILHTAPLLLNLAHNLMLQTAFPTDKNVVARVIADPEPSLTPDVTGLLDSELEHLYVPLGIGIVLPVTVCTFILPLAEDRSNNIMILMTIAGLRIDIYWIVTFLWDWLTLFVYSILFQIVMILVLLTEISVIHSLVIMLVINIYSFPMLVMIYFISMFRYKSIWHAFLIACLAQTIPGIFAFVIYWDVILGRTWFLYTFLISPTFAMLDGVSNAYVTAKFFSQCYKRCDDLNTCDKDDICKSFAECCDYHFFRWANPGVLRAIVFLLISTFIFILLMFWVEIHRRESKFYVTPKIKQMTTKVYPYDDSEISKMRDRIARMDMRNIAKTRLVVDQVENMIPKDNMFLSTVSFDVEKKKILAIYGTHHVGKSHLCRQLVGEDSFRFGDVYIRGIPIKYNVYDAWVFLGYCPQVRGILPGFTVIEVMHFFCLIRGVPKPAIPQIINEFGNILGLTKVMRRKVGRLSRGTQRKVSLAIALVATNKVIILDEPTRGLPQWTRREIWNALKYMRACGKTIVFSTTDMYECDALADAVLLVDDGEMAAYGGAHELRMKHVVGFFLEIRLRRDGNSVEEVEENFRLDVENLHRFMMFMHSDAVLLSRIDNCLKFYLPVEKINFNILYGSLEKNRVRLNIAEYTVSQGNFEEVLTNIAAKREHKKARK